MKNRPPTRSLSTKMCHMDKETKVCLIRVVVFIVYLHIGALVFMITEGKAPSERNAKEIMRTLQKKIVRKVQHDGE